MHFRAGDNCWPIRLCALRKSPLAAARAARKAHRKAQRQQRSAPSRKALALSRYLLVLTTLEPALWSGLQVLELYRCRWQIELAFKRLNGLLKLGYLPKNDPLSARA